MQRWLPDLLVGTVFVVCAVVAYRRQRGTGALLALVGVTWWLGNFVPSTVYFHRGVLLLVVATYPGWRPRTPAGAFLLLAGSFLVAAPGLAVTNQGSSLFGIALVVIAVTRFVGSTGQPRRHRSAAAAAAVTLLIGTTGGAVLDSVVNSPAWAEPRLLIYQGTLILAAMLLTIGLRSASSESIADLVVELDETRSGTFRDALARLLGDPLLEVGFLTGAGVYSNAQGNEIQVPGEDSDRAATFIDRGAGSQAVIVHDRTLLADGPLIEAVTSFARLSAANAELNAMARAQLTEVIASRRRLLAAEDEERRRLVARLHEGTGVRLSRVERLLVDALGDKDGSEPTAESTRRALHQLSLTRQDLSAIADGLSPWASEGDLARALQSLADRSPIPVEITVTGTPIDPEAATAVYYLCSEAVANTTKHAAASRISIEVTHEAGVTRVVVSDDGIGGADMNAGSGLRGLYDRLAALGGTLAVESRSDSGTRLIAELPANP